MKRTLVLVLAGAMAAGLAIYTAQAGAKIAIDDEAELDLGMRVQALFVSSERDLDGEGDLESSEDFRLRRGRLRLKATVNEYVSAFIQTEIGSGVDGSGLDGRVIDAFVTLQANPWLQLVAGENMAPASRQNLTSSGALMAIDRPGINYKSLTWGARSVAAFANYGFGDTDSGLRGEVDVRDLGATLFGSGEIGEDLHMKYYLGMYDGIQTAATDEKRYSGRIQVNMFDAEGGYYNSSTYLGGKKTVGVGVSIDSQADVADNAAGGTVDYEYMSADVFAELPMGPGSLTLEASYGELDLDDGAVDYDLDPLTAPTDLRQAQGDGFYVQAGYYINQWQPWVEYETWDSDGEGGRGGYDSYRAGISYFMKGHNANVKAGFEHIEADANIGTTAEDSIDSFVVGTYVTY